MICDHCKRAKSGLIWMSGSGGTYVICADCSEPLERELGDLSGRLLTCDTVDALLSEALAGAITITHADMGNMQLVDENGILRIREQRGFHKEFLEFFSAVHTNEAACGAALAERKTIAVEDVERSPIFVGTPAMQVMLNARARAVQSTPMCGRGGELIGIISTHYHMPRKFADDELRAVAFLASHAAKLFENVALAER